MNVYVEIIYQTHKFHQLAKVKIDEDSLHLIFPRAAKIQRHIEIPLAQISGFSKVEYFGTTQLYFYHGNQEYILFETGRGVVEYLEDKLAVR